MRGQRTRRGLIETSQLLRLEAAQGLTAGPKNLMLSSWKLFTKQIMTSNEYADIRKHVYKPLKRGSPTPLYYPLSWVASSEL